MDPNNNNSNKRVAYPYIPDFIPKRIYGVEVYDFEEANKPEKVKKEKEEANLEELYKLKIKELEERNEKTAEELKVTRHTVESLTKIVTKISEFPAPKTEPMKIMVENATMAKSEIFKIRRVSKFDRIEIEPVESLVSSLNFENEVEDPKESKKIEDERVNDEYDEVEEAEKEIEVVFEAKEKPEEEEELNGAEEEVLSEAEEEHEDLNVSEEPEPEEKNENVALMMEASMQFIEKMLETYIEPFESRSLHESPEKILETYIEPKSLRESTEVLSECSILSNHSNISIFSNYPFEAQEDEEDEVTIFEDLKKASLSLTLNAIKAIEAFEGNNNNECSKAQISESQRTFVVTPSLITERLKNDELLQLIDADVKAKVKELTGEIENYDVSIDEDFSGKSFAALSTTILDLESIQQAYSGTNFEAKLEDLRDLKAKLEEKGIFEESFPDLTDILEKIGSVEKVYIPIPSEDENKEEIKEELEVKEEETEPVQIVPEPKKEKPNKIKKSFIPIPVKNSHKGDKR